MESWETMIVLIFTTYMYSYLRKRFATELLDLLSGCLNPTLHSMGKLNFTAFSIPSNISRNNEIVGSELLHGSNYEPAGHFFDSCLYSRWQFYPAIFSRDCS
jgi:hypothetical protein